MASTALHIVFQQFAKNREISRDRAYRELHKGLSENADLFVAAGVLELPKLIDSLTKLEEFIRAGDTGNEKTAAEAISDWLNTPDLPEVIAS